MNVPIWNNTTTLFSSTYPPSWAFLPTTQLLWHCRKAQVSLAAALVPLSLGTGVIFTGKAWRTVQVSSSWRFGTDRRTRGLFSLIHTQSEVVFVFILLEGKDTGTVLKTPYYFKSAQDPGIELLKRPLLLASCLPGPSPMLLALSQSAAFVSAFSSTTSPSMPFPLAG